MRPLGDLSELRLDGAAGVSAPFTPASLGADLDAWYEVSDLSTIKEDRAGTTPASVNGLVGRILDKSGNDIHLTAIADITRGTLRQAGSVYYIEISAASNHGYASPGSLTWPATSDIFMALRNVGGTQWVSLYEAAGAGTILGVAQSGSASATHDNSGAVTDYVDGVLVSPATRGALYTAIGDGNDRVLGIYDAALADFGTVSLFRYLNSFNFGGRFHGMAITTANTARANMTSYMMGLQGR
jgi:hypothetical protein